MLLVTNGKIGLFEVEFFEMLAFVCRRELAIITFFSCTDDALFKMRKSPLAVFRNIYK